MPQVPQPLTDLADALSVLPGIGPKSAMRLALYLVFHSTSQQKLSAALSSLDLLAACEQCGNIASRREKLCYVCQDESRMDSLMVVENALDLINIEESGAYSGRYHVLGGLVSPVRGIGMEDISLSALYSRAKSLDEMILALPSSVEGDTTALLIKEQLQGQQPNLHVSRLGRGLPTGANIEYLDKETVRNSIEHRILL